MEETMQLKLKRLHKDAIIPKRANQGDSGVDLYALEKVILMPGVPKLVKTGWAMAIESGWEGQIRSRSGLAVKHGVTVANSPGTIDAGYRGEVGVILMWNGYNPTVRPYYRNSTVEWLKEDELHTAGYSIEDEQIGCGYRVERGDRIAQLIIQRVASPEIIEVDELGDTQRGEGGFGSSGT